MAEEELKEKIKEILNRGTGWYGTLKSHKEYIDSQAQEILSLLSINNNTNTHTNKNNKAGCKTGGMQG